MKYILALGIIVTIVGCGGPSEGEKALTDLRTAPANPNAHSDAMKALADAPKTGGSQIQDRKRMLMHRPGFR